MPVAGRVAEAPSPRRCPLWTALGSWTCWFSTNVAHQTGSRCDGITPDASRAHLDAESSAGGDETMSTHQAAATVRPFHVNVPEAELDRIAQAHQRDQVARTGNGHRCVARRTARDDSGAGALLGDRIRLAQDRGEAERPAAVHHRDRRAGHSFHSRPFETRKCAAADRHARMARLDHRADEDHRSADQSHRTRRKCIRCVPSGDPVDAGLRILRKADHDRVGPRPHCAGLDRADEAPRIHEIRGAGWRLGCDRHRADGRAGAAGIAGHSHQHGERDSTPTSTRRPFPARRRRRVSRPTRSSLTSG